MAMPIALTNAYRQSLANARRRGREQARLAGVTIAAFVEALTDEAIDEAMDEAFDENNLVFALHHKPRGDEARAMGLPTG